MFELFIQILTNMNLSSKQTLLTYLLYGPFLCMELNCLKPRATSRRQFTFYNLLPINSWYSFYQPRKDEKLSWAWSHPLVLNTGPLYWEFSTLANRPLFHTFLLYHSVHRGNNSSIKNIPPSLSCQSPLKSANCPSSLFFRQSPLYIVFCEPLPLKTRFFREPPNIRVFHP